MHIIDTWQKNASQLISVAAGRDHAELVVQNCNPILFWSIIIFSLQNIVFYFYWPNLIESLNMILINTGMF